MASAAAGGEVTRLGGADDRGGDHALLGTQARATVAVDTLRTFPICWTASTIALSLS
jgi:hypothetical protein